MTTCSPLLYINYLHCSNVISLWEFLEKLQYDRLKARNLYWMSLIRVMPPWTVYWTVFYCIQRWKLKLYYAKRWTEEPWTWGLCSDKSRLNLKFDYLCQRWKGHSDSYQQEMQKTVSAAACATCKKGSLKKRPMEDFCCIFGNFPTFLNVGFV